MTCFNEEEYIFESVNSVLSSNFTEFELVIIDDGSTDSSPSIISAMSQIDSRIRIFRNEQNLGVASSKNFGLKLCQGDLIAMMDADDICLPDRFIRQIVFMEANPTVVISGGAMYLMSEGSPALKPAVTNNLQKQLMLQNIFNHPTIILRRELMESGDFKYSPRFKHTEDYRLWTKLAYKVKMENLENPLIYFRANKAASKSNSAKAPIRREIEIVLIRLLFLGKLIIIRKCQPTDIRHFFATIVRSSVPSIVRSIYIRRRGG